MASSHERWSVLKATTHQTAARFMSLCPVRRHDIEQEYEAFEKLAEPVDDVELETRQKIALDLSNRWATYLFSESVHEFGRQVDQLAKRLPVIAGDPSR